MTAIYLYHGKTAFTFNYFNYKNGTQAINLAEFEMPCGSDIILVGAPNRAGDYLPRGLFLSAFNGIAARLRQSGAIAYAERQAAGR